MSDSKPLTLRIKPVAPFHLEHCAWALRRLPIDKVHRFQDGCLRRVVTISGEPALLEIVQEGSVDRPTLCVRALGKHLKEADKSAVKSAVTRLLGANINLEAFYKIAGGDSRLQRLAQMFRGLKPQRFPSAFEAFVNAVTCQQISLHVGILVLGRLVENYGEPAAGSEYFAFPQPDALAKAKPEHLVKLSYSNGKANYIIELARRIKSGDIDLEALDQLADEALMDKLLAIKGIGRWTAEYMLLRGYGRYNIFPIDDSGARARLIEFLNLKKDASYAQIERQVRKWDPYSGLLYLHLLLYHQRKRGYHQ